MTEVPEPPHHGWAVPTLSLPHLQKRDVRFLGREPIIRDLQAHLTRVCDTPSADVDLCLLSGPRGVGKSRIARELMFRWQRLGRTAWWAACHPGQDPLPGITRRLGLDHDGIGEPASETLGRYLRARTEPWLLVLDNLPDTQASSLEELRAAASSVPPAPSGRGGLILVTGESGRSRDLRNVLHRLDLPFEIDPLDADQGAEFLRSDGVGARETALGARDLAAALGGSPLALHLARAYLIEASQKDAVKELPTTFGSLQDLLTPCGSTPDALATLMELSLTLLLRRGLPDARRILELMSCFGPAPIPYPLLEPATITSSELFDSVDRRGLGEAYHRLEDLGLVRIDNMEGHGGGRHYKCTTELHSLVRETAAAGIPSHIRQSYQDLIARLIAPPVHWFEPVLRPYWPNWEVLSTHCESLVDLRELKDYRGVDSNGNTEANEVVRYTSPLLHAARYHLASGQQARAENAFAKVLETRRQGLDESDPDLMVAMHNLAVVHIARGELVQAHRELEDLLAAEEQYLRQDDTLILTTRALLAHLLHKLHQPARAREQWQRVLDVRLRRFGEARSSVLQVRYELALACRAVQDDEAAETQFREILSIVRNESRPEDDLSLRARHDLAALLVKRGSLKEAEELLASVLEWRTHLLGKDHPDVLPVKCELDGVRFRLGADDPGSDGDRSAQETPRSGERANRLAKKAAQILVQGAAEARQVLQELLKAKMERDPAWRHFITEQSTTGIRDKTRKWVELALADKLDEDPGLMRSVAEALPSAIAPSEQITPPESVGPAAQDRAELAPPDVAERPRAARKAALRGHVLVMATEWSSIHGGLSTFNRNLCRALAASGCVVICVVPEATDREQADAQADGVRLVSCDQLPGKPPLDRLLRRPQLPDGFRPDAVIGHGRVTGPAALSQVTDHFTTARLIHFLHVAPDEIEVFKADRERGHSESGERRTTVELDLARGADHAVAVGPRLHERYLTDLHTQKRPLRFDPGFDGGSDAIPTPPPGRPWKVLVSGRLEDAHLKGLDLAAKALGLTIRENHAELPTLELVARGAPEEEADQLAARLREWADAPSLNVVVRRYSADQEKLAMDLRQASLVLLPSRAEGFGLVGLEAIVAGIPVLVSSSSGLGNLLTEACGEEARRYVVRMTRDEAVDQDEWARKIGYMLFDREAAFSRAVALRDQLSGEGRTWANATRKLLKELHLDLRSDQVDLRESPAPAAPPPTTTSKR